MECQPWNFCTALYDLINHIDDGDRVYEHVCMCVCSCMCLIRRIETLVILTYMLKFGSNQVYHVTILARVLGVFEKKSEFPFFWTLSEN